MMPDPSDGKYAVPNDYHNLDEIRAPAPVQNTETSSQYHDTQLEDQDGADTSDPKPNPNSHGREQAVRDQDLDGENDTYDAPSNFANLTEMAPEEPVENPEEHRNYRHHSLEEDLGRSEVVQSDPKKQDKTHKGRTSRLLTEVITMSYLVLFSILGTLARLGLTSLNTYTGAPIVFSHLWANMAGTLVLGFLSEGAQLFGHPAAKRSIVRPSPTKDAQSSTQNGHSRNESESSSPALPIPLHIGLATGFCGSFTTFSGFIGETFSALANSASAPVYHLGGISSEIAPRGAGSDFMAFTAVIIVTLSTCFAGLRIGAHIAILLQQVYTGKHVPRHLYYWIDRATILLTVGVCAGSIIMAVLPPDRFKVPLSNGSTSGEEWRGQVLFALVFAPVGCLLRFYISSRLNNRLVGFPMGTFVVNMLGTIVMALAWDLQRAPSKPNGSLVSDKLSCQVLNGIIDGFCGCLTTVSTWILELSTLRRRHAYVYGLTSLFVALALAVVIMGTMKWTVGLSQLACST
ncbi:hypothetical protein G7046_g4052 [Stylonectria norvegica]|nr:hypothetical protein G7046_g4052 [Stylonectria norvegica]